MKDQHKRINGYRSLNVDEIDAMNQLKSLEVDVLNKLAELSNSPVNDMRWLSIAQTQIQQGFMAAVRAVARPEPGK